MVEYAAGVAEEPGSHKGIDQGCVGLCNVAGRHPDTTKSHGAGVDQECDETETETTELDSRGVPKVASRIPRAGPDDGASLRLFWFAD